SSSTTPARAIAPTPTAWSDRRPPRSAPTPAVACPSSSPRARRAPKVRRRRPGCAAIPKAKEAEAEAEALFRGAARRFVCGEGTAEADARLRVGRAVELVGFGATFDGRYAVVEVHHRFDAELGLRTEFKVERPGVGRRA
ncbi:MAG: hypothetical protein KC621_09470, partial [Myxococcales bacterium]|nr:hypothetical protein [Myxococcales bacterium]